jgi:hypothetical protein
MVQEFKKIFQVSNDMAYLYRSFATILIHRNEVIQDFNQKITTTLDIIPHGSKPYRNNLFHYYNTKMNPNIKYMLKHKLGTTLDGAKQSALDIEKNVEEFIVVSSYIMQIHFNKNT